MTRAPGDLIIKEQSRQSLSPAISARTDIDAVSIWLEARGGRSANTFLSYRREAVRLLVWLEQHNQSLATMRVEDVHAFFKLLVDPPADWIRPAKLTKGEVLKPTQTLRSGLSTRSLALSRTILSQLFSYLQDAGYLQRNVFRLSVRPPVMKTSEPTRLLFFDEWQWLKQWLDRMPASGKRQAAHASRCVWIFSVLYHTGIRREELAKAVMRDVVRRGQAWALHVIGKGQKERFVTLNSAVMTALANYRFSLGLEALPLPTEELPLVMSINSARQARQMTPRAIAKIITQVREMASVECPDPHTKAQISKMTTHWLRHTNASHRLLAGAALETTQDELGHADPRTTRLYAHTSAAMRLSDAEKLAGLSKE